MRKHNVAVLMLLVFFLFASAKAQDFSAETIGNNYQMLAAMNATDEFDQQVESIVKLFSSLVGSGFVHTASLHKVGGLDVGVSGVFVAVPDEFKDVVPDNVPTVKDPLTGADTVPYPFLHATLGLPANFEVMAKFGVFELTDTPNGKVTLIGGALKYGLLQGKAGLPSMVLLGGYQALFVPEDYAFGTVSTFSLKGYISTGFLIGTLYGGGGIERTGLTIDIPGIITQDYKLTYPSGTVGFSFTLLPLLKVNADYNFGEYGNFTLGAALSVR